MIAIATTINGSAVREEVDETLMLVDLLRDRLALLGTRVACDRGVCGACTVLVDGQLMAACNTFAFEADGRIVQTIEDVDTVPADLRQAFRDKGGFQCGYCTPGMLLLATALLARHPDPSRADVIAGMSANVCRCTGYQQIVDAVMAVVEARGASAR